MAKKTVHVIENRIKDILREKGMMPTELAKATGISDSYISRIISGDIKDVRVSTAYKISDVLEKPVEEIFVKQ